MWSAPVKRTSAERPADGARALRTDAQPGEQRRAPLRRLLPEGRLLSSEKRSYVELFYRELGGLSFDEKINENMVNLSCQIIYDRSINKE